MNEGKGIIMPLTDLNKLFGVEHDVSYYDNLLKYHKVIIRAVRNTTQKQVAEAIRMSAPKFSAVYRVLLAYEDAQNDT